MKKIGRPKKELVDGKYRCSLCGEYKYPSEFAKMKGSAHGYQSRCKLCKSKEHALKHPPKVKIIPETIVCRVCGLEKSRTDFRKNRLVCKLCVSIIRRPYFEKYRIESADKIKEHREETIDAIRAKSAEYYIKNRDVLRAKAKLYRSQIRERLRLEAIEYRKTHREQINAYFRNRKQTDVAFNLMTKIRGRFMEIVGNKLHGSKSKAIKKFVGITFEELKEYLESQFTEGMTWENHGTYWHIDHIIPCAAFDPTDESQVAMCFHYSNLQPLIGKDNASKQDILPNGKRGRDLRGNLAEVLAAFGKS